MPGEHHGQYPVDHVQPRQEGKVRREAAFHDRLHRYPAAADRRERRHRHHKHAGLADAVSSSNDPELRRDDADISLNRPFTYRGYRFFQSQTIPVGNARTITLELTPQNGGPTQTVEIQRLGSTTLADGTKVEYTEFEPDFALNGSQPDTQSADYNNPAAILNVTPPGGQPQRVFAFSAKLPDNAPIRHRRPDTSGISRLSRKRRSRATARDGGGSAAAPPRTPQPNALSHARRAQQRPKPGLRSIHEARDGRWPGGKYARPSTSMYLVGVGGHFPLTSSRALCRAAHSSRRRADAR